MVDALEDYGVEWLVTCRTFWPLLTSTLRFVRDARSLKITIFSISARCHSRKVTEVFAEAMVELEVCPEEYGVSL